MISLEKQMPGSAANAPDITYGPISTYVPEYSTPHPDCQIEIEIDDAIDDEHDAVDDAVARGSFLERLMALCEKAGVEIKRPRPDPHFAKLSSVEWCHRRVYLSNAGDGLQSHTYGCHYWRTCDRCLAERAFGIRCQLENALNHGPVLMLELANDDRRIGRMIEGYSKDCYLKLPGDAITHVFLSGDAVYPTSMGIIGEVLTRERLNHLELRTLARTPYGRHITGTLGEIKTAEPQGVVFEVAEFTYEPKPKKPQTRGIYAVLKDVAKHAAYHVSQMPVDDDVSFQKMLKQYGIAFGELLVKYAEPAGWEWHHCEPKKVCVAPPYTNIGIPLYDRAKLQRDLARQAA